MSTNRVNIVFNGNTDWDFNLVNGNQVPAGVSTSQGGTVSCTSCSSSYCARVFAAVECLKNVYQGESVLFEILLADRERTLINLNDVDSIQVYLYDDRNVITEIFEYPVVTGNNLTLGDHPLEIVQQTIDDTIVNRGRISITLTEEMTSNLLSGGIYAEIKLSMLDDTYVIGCLLLGKIRISRINQYSLEI